MDRKPTYRKVSSIKDVKEFRDYVDSLGIVLPLDDEIIVGPQSPLGQPIKLGNGRKIGNRFCIQPMEGWDGTLQGIPSELTFRRWKNFGRSGAKLIWGGEASAVLPEGRANPNQLMILDSSMGEIKHLRKALVEEHRENFGSTDDLYIGLQLTHSGRFCRPNEKNKLEPKIAYHHPLLDEIFHITADTPIVSDSEIEDIISAFIRAAKRTEKIGFDFVDIKHCHGYFTHELLSAVERPGNYGGTFENRTRFLREVVKGIRSECEDLTIGVRLSIFDFPPFRKDGDGVGKMMGYRNKNNRYPYAFGGNPEDASNILLDETIQFLELLKDLGIELVNFSAGSPYYNPHITRPAYYPPSDGYKPPEDPLVGVARQINTSSKLHRAMGNMITVGSAYSYLQEFLPNVAQAAVRSQQITFVGLGRMALSYPQMPADILKGKPLAKRRICRTFSDCTTAPRKGMVSGCYPLDHFYKERPEYSRLKELKKKRGNRRAQSI